MRTFHIFLNNSSTIEFDDFNTIWGCEVSRNMSFNDTALDGAKRSTLFSFTFRNSKYQQNKISF